MVVMAVVSAAFLSKKKLRQETDDSTVGSPVLRGLVSRKAKPSGCFCKNLVSTSANTEDLSGEIRSKSIISTLVSCLRDKVLLSPNDERYEVTLETSLEMLHCNEVEGGVRWRFLLSDGH